MRRLLPALLVVLAVVLAACASAAPGWTYAPPTEPPASQPAASADASAAPSAEAPSAETPSDGSGTGGDVVTVTAQGVAFLEKELTGPADTPFIIRFDNQDPGVPHDVVIRGANGQDLFKGEVFNGIEVRDYEVPAIPAGSYQFVCSIHPNMVGTITLGS